MNNELSHLMEDLADESAASIVAGSCAMIAREDGDWHDTTTMRGDAHIDFVRAMQYLHLRNRISRHTTLPHLVRIASTDATDPADDDVNHNPPRADITIIAGHASASTCPDLARAAQNVWLWLYTVPACSEPMVRYCPGCGSIGPIPKAYRDCCPDGAEARLIPQALAEKCRDTFKVAIKAMMADAAANDVSLVVPQMPEGWRERFLNEVYDNLAAADNQDVPLEEYPARILAVLDSIAVPPIVGNPARHRTAAEREIVMITITDMNRKQHHLAPAAIARVTEAGPNWHGIRSYVRTFDGHVIEACETAAEIAKAVQLQSKEGE